MALTPSCTQDFTREWVLAVMQSYYEQNFGETLGDIGHFRVEPDEPQPDPEQKKPEQAPDEEGREPPPANKTSHHVLSQAFKVQLLEWALSWLLG